MAIDKTKKSRPLVSFSMYFVAKIEHFSSIYLGTFDWGINVHLRLILVYFVDCFLKTRPKLKFSFTDQTILLEELRKKYQLSLTV